MTNENIEQLVQALNKQHSEGKLLKHKDLLFLLKQEMNTMMESNISKKTQLEVLKRKYPEIQYLASMSYRSYARLWQKNQKTSYAKKKKEEATELASKKEVYILEDKLETKDISLKIEEKTKSKITKEEFEQRMEALLRKKEKSPVSIDQAFSLEICKLEEIEENHKKNVDEEIENLRREYENYSY